MSDAIEELFDPGATLAHRLSREWTPEVQVTIMARLDATPPPRTGIVRKLVTALEEVRVRSRQGMQYRVRRHREIVDVVQVWWNRDRAEVVPKDANRRPDDVLVLEAGITSAQRMGDYASAVLWADEYARRYARKKPWKDHPGGNYDGCLVCLAAIEAIRSGERKRAVDALRAVPAEKLSETDVVDLGISLGRPLRRILFHHPPASCVLTDDLEVLWLENGALRPPPFRADYAPSNDLEHLAGVTRCDERVVYWSGKTTYSTFQRYGANLLWVAGKFEMSRGNAEIDIETWFDCESSEAAKALIATIAASFKKGFKRIDPWYDPKHGSVMRAYSDPGIAFSPARGVWGASWVQGFTEAKPMRSFATVDEARTAFEVMELERLQAGGVLRNLRRYLPNAPPA